jgi:hypothetical protein
LRDDEHDGDAVQVADQNRPREVVGEPAEAQGTRCQKASANKERERGRQLDCLPAAGRSERQDRSGNERRD